MRESVGLAANADSLEWCEFSVGDVDRLTALAYAGKISELGTSMYRLVVAKDAGVYTRCTNLLADRIKSKSIADGLPFNWRLQVAKQAINELMFPHCRSCNGAGEATGERGIKVECSVCDGNKTHRYGDSERADSIGVDRSVYKYKIAKRLDAAMAVLTDEIRRVNAQINNLLANA